jgi:hypothetical protein
MKQMLNIHCWILPKNKAKGNTEIMWCMVFYTCFVSHPLFQTIYVSFPQKTVKKPCLAIIILKSSPLRFISFVYSFVDQMIKCLTFQTFPFFVGKLYYTQNLEGKRVQANSFWKIYSWIKHSWHLHNYVHISWNYYKYILVNFAYFLGIFIFFFIVL